MREMSTADKQWLRQEIRSAVRQVLHEEFGEAVRFLRFVAENADKEMARRGVLWLEKVAGEEPEQE